eukprot:1172215-Alexandrium_andersonii.AAC.1
MLRPKPRQRAERSSPRPGALDTKDRLCQVRGCSRPHRGGATAPPHPPDWRLRRAGGASRG